jgi:hypothetical protein
MKKTPLLILVLLLARTLLAQSTQYVVIAVIDGARYSETFGDPLHQYIPRIWSTLRPLGTIYTSYRNAGLTETNPGHSSILTGTWQNIANDGSVRPHMPTLFEYFRKETGAPADQNYVILGKAKLNILAYGDHSDYGSAYGATVLTSASEYDDRIAFSNFKTAVSTSHPRIMAINLPKTDNAGHSGSWSAYLTGIRSADSLVNEMWNIVAADSLMAGKTTMFVTNDHGRHDDQHGGFQNHGDGCEGCRHIMLLVIGPDTPAGTVDSSARQQIDIAPTVGALLKFATPLAAGSMLSSAVTGVGVHSGQAAPASFELGQNYPNPFNPSTRIHIRVPHTGNVSLMIFNSLGQWVRTLVDGEEEAGSRELFFDGSGLASGVYFYRLRAGSSVQTRSMMFLK